MNSSPIFNAAMKRCIFCFCCFLLGLMYCSAQEYNPYQKDTFFLAKKKGILGRIGRSLNKSSEAPAKPRLTVEEFKPYYGKIIRHILIRPVGFSQKMGDTTQQRKQKFFDKVTNALHLNSTEELIRKHLFCKEGKPFYPLHAADNERYLRTLEFLRDAIIKVEPVEEDSTYVDVLVFTKDVFSIGGSLDFRGVNRFDGEIVEENFGGSGNQLQLSTLYDKARKPQMGYGASYMLRNMGGSFVNWTNGFQTFKPAFNSGRQEEFSVFSKIERPMVSRYTAFTGALEVSYHNTRNAYLGDSLYESDFKYSNLNLDMWMGFNLCSGRARRKDNPDYLNHFVAIRSFFIDFTRVPDKYHNVYNYQYADINGALLSYSIYKQNFYRTNFIYGFGRYEDVPRGIKATLIGGFTNKQGKKRAYYGTEAEWAYFDKRGSLFSYTVRTGGYAKKGGGFEDVDILTQFNHFTPLFRLSKQWLNRNYFTINYTRQLKARLNEPLFMDSDFGLPYYERGLLEGQKRAVLKAETMFYHLRKFLGFRFAPFVFSDLALMQAIDKPASKAKGYPVLGAGIRTRNENLVLGTIELRGYYFPQPFDGMKGWRVSLGTNLRFRYSSNFVRKPDFVSPN